MTGCITAPFIPQPLGKLNDTMDVKNYTESNGCWDIQVLGYTAAATWLINARGPASRPGPAQSKPVRTVEGDKIAVVRIKNLLGKTV